jgi:hypothetical protein
MWRIRECRNSPASVQQTYYIIAWVSFCQDPLLPYQRDMSQQQDVQLSSQEGRIKFAFSAYNTH